MSIWSKLFNKQRASGVVIKQYYEAARERAFNAALKRTIDGDPSANAFTAVFSQHDDHREFARKTARKETMKKFKLTEAELDSVWRE